MRALPIGVDDFRDLRERGLAYVDKSLLVRDVLDTGAQVLLLPRPRRFGKTLGLSMLRYFFERQPEDRWPLFADLAIAAQGERYRAACGRYPVIFVTFKGVDALRWDLAWAKIQSKIAELYDEHRALLTSGVLSPREERRYRAILDGTADREMYEASLADLCRVLARAHGEKVVMLIDEYDKPITVGVTNGFADEAISFSRGLLGEALKSNPHLYKAVVTGVLRVAKESIFSGLNNMDVHTILDRKFAAAFGFTEAEVRALFDEAGLPHPQRDLARRWYNGYTFGGEVIYNPWSIMSFLDRGGAPEGYWVSTSSNDWIREAMERHAPAIEREMEALLRGGKIERRLNKNVVLADLSTDEGALYSLLVFSGYLRAEVVEALPDAAPTYLLSIPNVEVRDIYSSTFRAWMARRLGGQERDVERLTRALLSGDAEALAAELQRFTENVLSYYDLARRPEQVYHVFVLGLLAVMEPRYRVRSNRESGAGRPDVLIEPRTAGEPGAVLELKVVRAGEGPERALGEAVAQIRDKDYAAELRAAGANPIHAFAVAFDGKTVWARAVEGG